MVVAAEALLQAAAEAGSSQLRNLRLFVLKSLERRQGASFVRGALQVFIFEA